MKSFAVRTKYGWHLFYFMPSGQGGHSVAEDNAFLIRALRSDKLKAPKETPDGLTVGDFARWSGGDAHSGLRDATHLVQEMIRETSEGIAEKVAETALQGVAAKFAVTMIAGIKFAPNKAFPKDFATKNTNHWSGAFKSEGEARALARSKLGKNPVEIEPGKLRSVDGKWQYRAKPGDLAENHIHLEELDPVTGEVLQNLHLRWPNGTGR